MVICIDETDVLVYHSYYNCSYNNNEKYIYALCGKQNEKIYTYYNMTYLDPSIWGPHFWFFLHTIAMTYPNNPNDVNKKKYYEFVQNLELFLPSESISSDFKQLLSDYPITPYLDNRESFVRWVWFIHNKINTKLEKPQITLEEFYKQYRDEYKSTNTKIMEYYRFREKILYVCIIFALSGTIYYLYDK